MIKNKSFAVIVAAVGAVAVVAVGLMFNFADKKAASYPSTEEQEKIAALIEDYAEAFYSRDGAAIADSYRYTIDWENEKADIWYYAWTSDPHITVWKEEKYYIKDGGEYRLADGNLEYMDSISSKEEFDKAYRIQEEYKFVDYIENGFADTIIYQNENGMSTVDNTVYEEPVTAAVHILNLTGGEGEGSAKSDMTGQSMVRYRFADGSEITIPMMRQSAEGEKPVWIVDVAVWNAGAP
ncbi:MAG: hypothetical protein NC231_12445 [Bacillus sp. (in: Bacteria)]|nr:hypothetical protein [Bacillus sp. (in: firmicutes)]MCM1425420.1 hypothetical protein [Eubacterium sp.]